MTRSQCRAGEKIADVFQFAHACHRVADAPRLEIGHRQGQQVMKQARAKFDVDAVGGMREQICPQHPQHRFKNRNRHQADSQHVEGAQGAMDQNLVDDHLEEQRRDQAKQLQKERCDQHLAQQMPVFANGPHEPSDVETAGNVRQSRPAGNQDQPAVPDRKKFSARHQSRPGCPRRLDQDFVLARFGDHHETAVTQGGDSGQGHFDKPRPLGAANPCLEPKILGAPEHLRCANSCCSQPMPDLFAVSRDTVEA